MSFDLYYTPASSPCRAVLAVGKELGIDFHLKSVNLREKEQLKPEFLAINPQHCLPTLVDNDDGGFALWESRAILTYLVDRVSPDHKLYPKDLKTRATINRWLNFDAGSLYPAMSAIAVSTLWFGQPLDPAKVTTLKDKLKLLDEALAEKKFLVTDHRTLADLCILVNVTSLSIIDGLDISEFGNIATWVNGLKEELSYYDEVNEAGLRIIKSWIHARDSHK